MKSFVFLYPIKEKFDVAIKSWCYGKESAEKFRKRCKNYINDIIDLRYRRKGFEINYALYDDTEVSDIIDMKKEDNVFNVGLTYEKQRIKINGKYPYYPDNDLILNTLDTKFLRIGGFCMWDCVDKLAKRAYKRGIDVLVDEDLTEFMFRRVFDKKLDRKKYNPRYIFKNKLLPGFEEDFLNARKERPWLFNDYK